MPLKRPIPAGIAGPIHAGWGYDSPHDRYRRPQGLPAYVLLLTLKGQAACRQPGRPPLLARPGDVLLLEPNVPQDYGPAHGSASWHSIWVHFEPRPEWESLLHWPLVQPGIRRTRPRGRQVAQIRSLFQKVCELCIGDLPARLKLARLALEELLVWCEMINADATIDARVLDPRIARAASLLSERYRENLGIPQLAAAVDMSESRLAHLFRQQLGVTPGQYLQRRRLEQAARLLTMTDLPLKQIADQTGFCNPYYLSARFKEAYGRAPGAYRRAIRTEV